MGRTVSVMQPYFFPYGGYYRLLAAADVFVIYDCVQFPRRGYVHRNRLRTSDGTLDWLTMPIAPCPQNTLISNLVFQQNAHDIFRKRIARFPSLAAAVQTERDTHMPTEIADAIFDFDQAPVEYLERTIVATAGILGLQPEIIRSSALSLEAELRADDRVLSIIRKLDGERYVNAPGGRDLYDRAKFREHGVELTFLDPFEGGEESSLEILCDGGVSALRDVVGCA